MALPTNADVIVVHGYWLDELTGLGVKQANGLPATIMFDPVPLLGANTTKTPNLRDLTSNAHLKTRTRVASVDPVTGYYAAQLVASNDPDLDAYSGRKVTFLGEDPFTIEVPYNAPTVTVSAEMAAKTGLTQGSSVKAIWLPNASVTTIPTPTPPNNYLTSTQTLANIAAGIETHDEDPTAHADIRALIGTGGSYTDEQARDALAAALVAGAGITITVDDAANTITLTATGGSGGSYTDEQAQDALAALVAAGTHSGITFAYNDAGNAISATVSAQSWTQITGKPTFATVATSGAYTDLTGRPTFATVATSGAYTDLTGRPTIPDTSTLVAKDTLVYNARDHGMVGDWVSAGSPGTNDQPALATLVNTLGAAYVSDGRPRHIYVPPGDYSMRDAGTVWKSGVSLIGAGPGLTRFHLSNPVNTTNPTPLAAYTAAFNSASTSAPLVDCTFANFEVDGSAVTLPSYTTGPKALVLQYMVRARFQNLYLHDCGATALGCDFLQDTIIDGVVAINNGRLNNGSQPGGAGIGIGIGGWGSIERTTIVNCTTKGNGTHGIFVELQDNTYTRPRGIRIVGCHSEGNKHGISDWGADGLIVSGCSIVGNTADGFNVAGSGVAGFAGVGGIVTGCVIDGNTLDGVLLGDTPGPYTVRGNRVTNNGRHGIHLASTTQATSYAVSSPVFAENDIYSNAFAGIRTDCVMTDGFITSNRIRNNGTATAQTTDLRAGISFNAAANSPTVIANRLWDNQGTKTQTYGWYITSSGTAGSATAQDNNINGNLTGAYNFQGSVSGGMWNQNAGFAPNATSGAQTTILDGNVYISGTVRNAAQVRNWTSATLTPSATAGTAGTAQTCSPNSNQLGFINFQLISVLFAGTFVSETVTATITATFSDNSTGTATVTSTSATRVNLAGSAFISLFKDATYVKTVAVTLSSTIANSTVTATANVVATQC